MKWILFLLALSLTVRQPLVWAQAAKDKPATPNKPQPAKAKPALLNLNGAIVVLRGDVEVSSDKDTAIEYSIVKELGTPSQEEVDQAKKYPEEEAFKWLKSSTVRTWKARSRYAADDRGQYLTTIYGLNLFVLVRKGSQFINGTYEDAANKCSLTDSNLNSPTLRFEVDNKGQLLSDVVLRLCGGTMGTPNLKIKLPQFTHEGVNFHNGALISVTAFAMPLYIESNLPIPKDRKTWQPPAPGTFAKLRFVPSEIPDVIFTNWSPEGDSVATVAVLPDKKQLDPQSTAGQLAAAAARNGAGKYLPPRRGYFAMLAPFFGSADFPGEDEATVGLSGLLPGPEADQLRINCY